MIDYGRKYKILRQSLGLSQAEFAIKTGTSRSIISQIEIGKLKPSLENIAATSEIFNVSLTYFFRSDKNLTEETYLQCNLIPADLASEPSLALKPADQKSEILFVPVKARGSYISHFGDPEYLRQLEHFSIPGCRNGNYRMFEAEGYSMIPSINNGDNIIGEKLQKTTSVKKNCIYIIVTLSAGVIIKRVINTELNRDTGSFKLQLAGDNPDKVIHPVIELNASDIIEIWQFHMLITTQTVDSDKILGRLSGIEHKIEKIRLQLEKR
jgi:transcriptional regulator with XRE-family HTH domain